MSLKIVSCCGDRISYTDKSSVLVYKHQTLPFKAISALKHYIGRRKTKQTKCKQTRPKAQIKKALRYSSTWVQACIMFFSLGEICVPCKWFLSIDFTVCKYCHYILFTRDPQKCHCFPFQKIKKLVGL